jgi:hypothetical protein
MTYRVLCEHRRARATGIEVQIRCIVGQKLLGNFMSDVRACYNAGRGYGSVFSYEHLGSHVTRTDMMKYCA